jgi:hypothetical protein
MEHPMTLNSFLDEVLAIVVAAAITGIVAYIFRDRVDQWIRSAISWLSAHTWAIAIVTAVLTSIVVTPVVLSLADVLNREPVQLEFWTPSAQTQQTLAVKQDKNLAWTIIDDQKLVDFALTIGRNRKQVLGFRWYDVRGRGDGPMMAGT